ncbi:MAG TPA: hypothetical protein VGQ35_10215 [Dongiaceae bacterium]|nr:hypothetical protein [Dongiaceae bacterium]
MLTVALWAIGVGIVYAFADVLTGVDKSGIAPMLVAFLPPLCLGWWLYTKSLRRFAERLALKVPAWTLGIPLVGEFHVISAMIFPR